MRDEFDIEFGGIIDAHAESMMGEDETYAEARNRVSRGYRRENFFDDAEDYNDDED